MRQWDDASVCVVEATWERSEILESDGVGRTQCAVGLEGLFREEFEDLRDREQLRDGSRELVNGWKGYGSACHILR